jgi:hypothetical protein
MALKQTRRTISLNRGVYDAIMRAAAEQNVAASVIVERGVRAIGVVLPETSHMTPVAVRRMKCARGYTVTKRPRRADGGVPIVRPSYERKMLGDSLADALGFP